MEALLMVGVVLATVAIGALCKDRYDDDEHGSSGSCTSSSSHRSIDDYHRHPLNHTQKLR